MDTLMATGEVAGMLGVSMPTVRRTAERLGLDAERTDGGHRRFSPAQVQQLAAVLGETPRVTGLTRSEVQVLAALARRPLGVRSMRTIARATGLSPTTASATVERLEEAGLVETSTETVAEGGARQVEVTRLRISQPWFSIASSVNQTVLPRIDAPPAGAGNRIPLRFAHLFWNANPNQLSTKDDAVYIARRMITGADPAARAWVVRTLPEGALRDAVHGRGIDASTRALVTNALAAR